MNYATRPIFTQERREGKKKPQGMSRHHFPSQKEEEGEMQGHAEKSGNISWQWGIREKGRVEESLCTAKKRRQPSVFLLLFSLVCTAFVWKGEGKEEQVSINWIIDGGIRSGLQVLLQSTKALRGATEEEKDCTFEWGGGRGEPNMATISTSVSFCCCNIIEYACWPSNMGIRDQLYKKN